MCVRVKSLQKPDRVDVEMVEEVCIGRPSVGTLVLHQEALQGLLTGVALLHHPQLRQKKKDLSVATSGVLIGQHPL